MEMIMMIFGPFLVGEVDRNIPSSSAQAPLNETEEQKEARLKKERSLAAIEGTQLGNGSLYDVIISGGCYAMMNWCSMVYIYHSTYVLNVLTCSIWL